MIRALLTVAVFIAIALIVGLLGALSSWRKLNRAEQARMLEHE